MSDSEESELSGIISISGKPGLYKVITQTKSGLIVESLTENKRLPVHASDKVSALEDISVYTETDDVPLQEVFELMMKVTSGKAALDHKTNPQELREHFAGVVKDFDGDRVYNSDLKKIYQWYNLLVGAGLLAQEKPKAKAKTKAKPKAKKKAEKVEDSSSEESVEENSADENVESKEEES